MQQLIPKLNIGDLVEANIMLKETVDLRSPLQFGVPTQVSNPATVLTSLHAYSNISKSHSYENSGVTSGNRFASK